MLYRKTLSPFGLTLKKLLIALRTTYSLQVKSDIFNFKLDVSIWLLFTFKMNLFDKF